MANFIVTFTDGTTQNVTGWDISSAYEFAQDLYNKPIKSVIPA